MAYKTKTDRAKEQLKTLMHYGIRVVPVVVVVGAIVWFFLLRSPNDQTNTAGTTGTGGSSAPETTVSTKAPAMQEQAKVEDNSAMAAASDGKGGKGNLPETGPAGTLAVFAIPALAGTLFWEWRLRRANSAQSRSKPTM